MPNLTATLEDCGAVCLSVVVSDAELELLENRTGAVPVGGFVERFDWLGTSDHFQSKSRLRASTTGGGCISEVGGFKKLNMGF